MTLKGYIRVLETHLPSKFYVSSCPGAKCAKVRSYTIDVCGCRSTIDGRRWARRPASRRAFGGYRPKAPPGNYPMVQFIDLGAVDGVTGLGRAKAIMFTVCKPSGKSAMLGIKGEIIMGNR